jgi:hypothetical protein
MKKFIIHLIRSIKPAITKHYLWPIFTHSRSFDFKKYYKKSKIRVNLGAGPYFICNDWISIDLGTKSNPSKNYFVKNFTYKNLDLNNFEGFEIKKIDVCYASHFLEHLNEKQLKLLLVNLRKLFNQNGVFRIVVPDADLIIDRLKNNDLEYFLPIKPALSKYNIKFTKINIFYFLLNLSALLGFEDMDIDENMLNRHSSHKLISLLNKNSASRKNNSDGSLHLIALNYEALRNYLRNAGFKNVYRSAFMQSRVGEMRETPIFDGTHPWLSLYVEAVA